MVYLKKVGTKKVPSLKLTVKKMHPHPEYEGDIEGQTSETLRFTRGR